MFSHGLVSKLAEQVVNVSARAIEARSRGLQVPVTQAVVRSLRTTLATIAERKDPREFGAEGFLCTADLEGRPTVRWKGRLLPVSGSYLRHLLEALGADLVPGQVLLLDAALVRHLVEEALPRIGQEEAAARDRKSRLLAAHLAADALDHGRLHPADRLPSEAA